MNNLGLLVEKIKRDKGFDLSGYKESTLTRRIERRIRFDGAESLEEYITMIDRDYHLYWRLVSDFFIGVTDFFRDKEIWKTVQEKVLPEIIATKGKGQGPLRMWSAGCSTGEETYSLAIAVRETLRKSEIKDLPVFIYGTDIMEDKLEQAKRGIYSEDKLKGVNGNVRFRYFERIADDLNVIARRHEVPTKQSRREIASLTSFARNDRSTIRYTLNASTKRLTRFRKYDLARPETMTGFDMIVCRNVLIYFERKLQEKVIKHFHKALRPRGLLWLGKAESLSKETESLFEPVYKKERIFRKL
ncbi:MAG: protein-glutamate O-methyltransferase CheR [Candidatus Omnitrophica bacterium]|nr:protein-glutamate O-methyltransferase CheR [Candidatus Omnitrophota bacterium]